MSMLKSNLILFITTLLIIVSIVNGFTPFKQSFPTTLVSYYSLIDNAGNAFYYSHASGNLTTFGAGIKYASISGASQSGLRFCAISVDGKTLTCRYLSGTTLSYNVDNWRTVSTDGLMACGLTYGGTPSCLSLSDDPSNFTLFDPSVNSGYTLSGSCIWNGMLCGIVQSDLSVQCFKGGSSVRTLFSATTYRRVFCSNIGSLSKICAARKDGSAADCNQISINTNNETISTLNGQDGKLIDTIGMGPSTFCVIHTDGSGYCKSYNKTASFTNRSVMQPLAGAQTYLYQNIGSSELISSSLATFDTISSDMSICGSSDSNFGEVCDNLIRCTKTCHCDIGTVVTNSGDCVEEPINPKLTNFFPKNKTAVVQINEFMTDLKYQYCNTDGQCGGISNAIINPINMIASCGSGIPTGAIRIHLIATVTSGSTNSTKEFDTFFNIDDWSPVIKPITKLTTLNSTVTASVEASVNIISNFNNLFDNQSHFSKTKKDFDESRKSQGSGIKSIRCFYSNHTQFIEQKLVSSFTLKVNFTSGSTDVSGYCFAIDNSDNVGKSVSFNFTRENAFLDCKSYPPEQCKKIPSCSWCPTTLTCLWKQSDCKVAVNCSGIINQDWCMTSGCSWCEGTQSCAISGLCSSFSCSDYGVEDCVQHLECGFCQTTSLCISNTSVSNSTICPVDCSSRNESTSCNSLASCTWCQSQKNCVSKEYFKMTTSNTSTVPSCICKSIKNSTTCNESLVGCSWCENPNTHLGTCLGKGITCDACATFGDGCSASACYWCSALGRCVSGAANCSTCGNQTKDFCTVTDLPGCTWCPISKNCRPIEEIDNPSCSCSANSVSSTCLGECSWCEYTSKCQSTRCTPCAARKLFCNGTCHKCSGSSTCLASSTPCLTCGDLGWTDSSSSCSIVAINCSRCDFRQSCVSASSVDSTCSIQDPQGHDLEIGLGVGIGGGGLLILALVSAILVAVLMRKKDGDDKEGSKEKQQNVVELCNIVLANKIAGSSELVLNDSPLGFEVDRNLISFSQILSVDEKATETFVIHLGSQSRNETIKLELVEDSCNAVKLTFEPREITLKPGNESQTVQITAKPLCSTKINTRFAILREGVGHTFLPVEGMVAPSTRLNWDDIEMNEIVGEGAAGIVYKGRFRGEVVAVKEVKGVMADLGDQRDEAMKEAGMLSKLRSPHIILFYGVAATPTRMAFVMEFCPMGTVLGAVMKGKLNMAMKLKVMLNACQGMSYLHENGIIHRDLKSENLLMVSMTASSDVVCKLSDFGTSRQINDDLAQKYTKAVGTPLYMSPEQLSSKSYSKPADVYSFGITAWEIMAAQVPFSQAKSSFDLIKLVSEGNRPEKLPSNKCPPALWKNIIVPSWDQEPSQRPTFTELVERLSSPLAILGN